MDRKSLNRIINIPQRSSMQEQQYKDFLVDSFDLILQTGQYIAPDENINDLELAHLIPAVSETVLAIYDYRSVGLRLSRIGVFGSAGIAALKRTLL